MKKKENSFKYGLSSLMYGLGLVGIGIILFAFVGDGFEAQKIGIEILWLLLIIGGIIAVFISAIAYLISRFKRN